MNNKPDYIIDAHQHLWGFEKDEYSQSDTVEALLESNLKYGIRESWISCFPLDGRELSDENTNLPVERAFRRYPGDFRGMGFVLLGRDGADKVKELKERGFFGLKIIFPLCGYDDSRNDPVWESAIEYKMPVTFHTGLANSAPFRHVKPLDMFPDRLYRLISNFPELIMLVAHMGNNHFFDAAALATGKNVYLDCSGGSAVKGMSRSYFDNTVHWKEVKDKLVFGIDNLCRHFEHNILATTDFATEVGLSEAEVELMWRGNAEKIIAAVS